MPSMSAKRLNSAALALHHRLGRQRAEIAEPEDGRAVGDHRHEVALVGVVVGQLRVLGDGLHGHGDARRIGEREVALGGQRLGRHDLELAGLALAVELQRLLGREARRIELEHHGHSPCPAGGRKAKRPQTISFAPVRHNRSRPLQSGISRGSAISAGPTAPTQTPSTPQRLSARGFVRKEGGAGRCGCAPVWPGDLHSGVGRTNALLGRLGLAAALGGHPTDRSA